MIKRFRAWLYAMCIGQREPRWLYHLRRSIVDFGAERHRCQRREENHYGQIGDGPAPDKWQRHANGDRVCSYCGSLHPDDFLQLCKDATDPQSDLMLDGSTKSYKVYVHRPSVRNASDGGIKFYMMHVKHPVTDEQQNLFKAAMKLSSEKWRKRFAQASE